MISKLSFNRPGYSRHANQLAYIFTRRNWHRIKNPEDTIKELDWALLFLEAALTTEEEDRVSKTPTHEMPRKTYQFVYAALVDQGRAPYGTYYTRDGHHMLIRTHIEEIKLLRDQLRDNLPVTASSTTLSTLTDLFRYVTKDNRYEMVDTEVCGCTG